MESMRYEWSGDVDLGDGQVEALHQRYKVQLEFVKGIGVKKGIVSHSRRYKTAVDYPAR